MRCSVTTTSLSTTYSDLEDEAEISFCRLLDDDAVEEEEEEEEGEEASLASPPFGSGLIVVPYSSEM